MLSSSFDCGLPDLSPNILIRVTDAFPFVGLRRTVTPNICCDLPHLLLIDPRNHENLLILRIVLDLDSSRSLVLDGVRVSELQRHTLPFPLCLETDTDYFETLLIPLADPLHHTREESPCETMTRSCFAGIIGPRHLHLLLCRFHLCLWQELQCKFAFRSFHRHYSPED